MGKIIEKPIIFGSILVLLCAYLFFFQSGRMALTDPDETFYAQTAREMLNRQEWSTPYLYGHPQFEKPALFYWLVEASFKIFGVNEFAARLPSAIFALIGVFSIYFLGKILFTKRVGMLAAVILATNVEYVILSRACVTDMVLSTFMLLGVLFFFYGYLKKKDYFYLLSSASFALATLTKGPIAIILPGAVIISYLLLIKDYSIFKKSVLPLSILVFLSIALPWYLLMYKFHGKGFVEVFFGFHNITRFLESEHKVGSQVYYNIPIMFGGFFPWSAFLVFGFWRAFVKSFSKDVKERHHCVFILMWFFVIFLFFSASSTKLPTYIFPSFISLALIAALLWDDFLNINASKAVTIGMSLSYCLLLGAVIVGPIAALIYISSHYSEVLNGVFVASMLLIFVMLLSLVAYLYKRFIWAFFLIVFSVAAFLYPLSELVLTKIEPYESSKEVAAKLLSLMKKGEKVGSESNYLAGLAFYAGVIPTDIDKHHNLVKFLDTDDRVWCVMKEKNHIELYELIREDEVYYYRPSYMVYKLGKRAIVTNKMPDDGVYMIKREKK